MKRIYIIFGELEDANEIDTIEGSYLTMEEAEQRCLELEAEHDGHIWYWRESVLKEEGD